MVQNQAYLFLVFSLTGVAIGVLFDFFRILRRTIKTANIITYDPSTNNPVNGSYQFMIYNAGDWATLNGTTNNGW